jgi:hypothetical protein
MPSYDAQAFQPPAPMATVTISTRDGQKSIAGVGMLMDTGADVSLIPESSAQLLGLETRGQKDYELMSFDGNRSVAKSVQCQLIFLRRAFRGTFLVVDVPVGILGRDVLNHVSLLLDGPRLTWQEERIPR